MFVTESFQLADEPSPDAKQRPHFGVSLLRSRVQMKSFDESFLIKFETSGAAWISHELFRLASRAPGSSAYVVFFVVGQAAFEST